MTWVVCHVSVRHVDADSTCPVGGQRWTPQAMTLSDGRPCGLTTRPLPEQAAVEVAFRLGGVAAAARIGRAAAGIDTYAGAMAALGRLDPLESRGSRDL